MNLIEYAKNELQVAGYIPLDQEQEDGPNKWMQESVLELLEVFSKQGHSGASAPYVIKVFASLANYQPLSPLTGEDSEWMEENEGIQQSKRSFRVFRNVEDGTAYDIQGKVFYDEDGISYTNSDSKVNVTFPYTPATEYIKAPKETEEKVEEDGYKLPEQPSS